MNLLEHYIKEIISEKCVRKYDEDWVEVKLIIKCYGVTEEKTKLFLREDWEKIKSQGYYMA
jgi:hypothetical protein